jgi:signal transduction histidine kinase
LQLAGLIVACAALITGVLIGRFLAERKRQDPPSVAALRRARALLNALPDTWLVIDAHDQVSELHFAPRPGSRAPIPQLRGKRVEDFFSPAVVVKLNVARERSVAEQSEEIFEFDMHVRGETRAAMARVLPLPPDEVVVVIQDISQRKMTERALHETRAFAESMLSARTDAFARLSHDVRNQMAGVLTITDMLLAREAAPAARRYLETIQRCGDNIVELVGNMMELSRLERGGITFHATTVELESLVGECVEVARAHCSADTRMAFHVSNRAPRSVVVDPTRLRQVLMNLLHNAAKFTSEGSILVEVDAENSEHFSISVRDTGRGIAAEALPRIFDAYFQVRDPDHHRESARHAGSGLGLAIVMQLSRAMGGDVKVESEEGSGTCFVVTLPRGEPEQLTRVPPNNAGRMAQA